MSVVSVELVLHRYKTALCLLHYHHKIKFIHLFIRSPSLSLSLSSLSLRWSVVQLFLMSTDEG